MLVSKVGLLDRKELLPAHQFVVLLVYQNLGAC
jgi:hypothetical protein